MDIGVFLDAIGISFVVSVCVVVAIAAIVFVFLKKKQDSDYDPKDVPKRIEDPKETQGSTGRDKDSDL